MAIHILEGTEVPATTPSEVGQHFIDTTNKIAYTSVGTASSADWSAGGSGGGDYIDDTVAAATLQGAYTLVMDGAELMHNVYSTSTGYAIQLDEPTDTTKIYVRYISFEPSGPATKPTVTALTGTIRVAGTGFVDASFGMCKVIGMPDNGGSYIYYLEFHNA